MATIVVNKTTLKNYDKNFKGTKSKSNSKVKVYDRYGRRLKLEGGHYSILSHNGKIAHNYNCKCKLHINYYIKNVATTKEIEKGIKIENITYKTCNKCHWIDNLNTQLNVTDTSVWLQNDESIIVRI